MLLWLIGLSQASGIVRRAGGRGAAGEGRRRLRVCHRLCAGAKQHLCHMLAKLMQWQYVAGRGEACVRKGRGGEEKDRHRTRDGHHPHVRLHCGEAAAGKRGEIPRGGQVSLLFSSWKINKKYKFIFYCSGCRGATCSCSTPCAAWPTLATRSTRSTWEAPLTGGGERRRWRALRG